MAGCAAVCPPQGQRHQRTAVDCTLGEEAAAGVGAGTLSPVTWDSRSRHLAATAGRMHAYRRDIRGPVFDVAWQLAPSPHEDDFPARAPLADA